MTVLDRRAVERFRGDLLAITGTEPGHDHVLGLAVSGGADSLALLLLAQAAYPGCVAVATVDHGLRPEGAAEAAFVAAVCGRIDVPHATLRPPAGVPLVGNVQDWARAVRYAALDAWGHPPVAWIATAHQRDDVAESFLMRARRGAGLGGLAAMPVLRPGGSGVPVVRPLLGWSRGELAAVAAAAGIAPVADPSNADPRFDRSRIRRLIADTPDLPADRLALAATNLRHAEDALEWVVEREWAARHTVQGEKVWLDPSDLPYEIRRRLAGRAIRHIRAANGIAAPWPGTGLDRFVAALDAGRHATLAQVAARSGPRWRFAPAPPHRRL